MTLKSILDEIDRKCNDFADACVILTRSKDAIKIIEKEIEHLDSQAKVERYTRSLSELKKIPTLLDEYSKTLDSRMENGDGFRFAKLSNTAYSAIEALI
jgi:hypothetical protein